MSSVLLPMSLDVSSICQRVLAENRHNSHNRGTITPCLGTCDVSVSIKIKISHVFTKRDHYKNVNESILYSLPIYILKS